MSWTPQLGWISPKDRNNDEHDAHAAANASMPKFAMPQIGVNEVFETTGKFDLTEIWANEAVKQALGFIFKRFHQITGSCVGAGGGQVVFTTIAGDAIYRGEAEEIFLPFWPYDYGLSRMLGGNTRKGDGSLGSLFAKAVRDYGIIRADHAGLPKFHNGDDDGLTLTKQQELDWSIGQTIDKELVNLGKEHPIKTTAPIKSVDDAKNAILNKYGITFASDLYIGHGSIKGSGDNACVVGHLDTNGGHQTAWLGYWEHPQLGPMFKNQNNWPAEVYPRDPQGGSVCAVWQPAADVEKALRYYNAEAYAFSGFEGFPAQDVPTDWMQL